jgi:large subunit ribosomal protein L9
MEVILLEQVDKLGQMGDVVKVKSGYARNYLLPQKKAMRATEANKSHFEQQRAQLEAVNLEQRQEAEKLGKKMEGLSIILIRQAGEAGQLYGSVNARDIAAAVTEGGFTITRQQVGLANPIKSLGVYEVRVVLHPEVSINVSTNVARSKDEAKTQAKTGKAVTSSGEEEAAKALAAEAGPVEAEGEAKAKKPKAKKAKAAEIDEESAKAVEDAANEAVAEQAEKIFEEGAQPEVTPETDETAAEAEAGAGEEKATDGPEPKDGKGKSKKKTK